MAWLSIVELLRCREMMAMNSADASPCILGSGGARARRANKARPAKVKTRGVNQQPRVLLNKQRGEISSDRAGCARYCGACMYYM